MAVVKLVIVALFGAYILLRANAKVGVYFLWFSWITHMSWFGGLGWLSANNLIAGCSVLAVLVRLRSPWVRRLNNRTTWLVIAWMACLLAGAMRAGRLVERVDELVPCLCICFITVLIDWREKDFRTFLLVVAAPTLLQVARVTLLSGSEVWYGGVRPDVVGVQLSGLGHQCAALVPLALGFAMMRRRGSRTLAWFVFGSALTGVLISKSRGGALLFLLAVILTAAVGLTRHGGVQRSSRSGSRQSFGRAWTRLGGRLGLALASLVVLAGALWIVLPPRYFARYRYGPDADWAQPEHGRGPACPAGGRAARNAPANPGPQSLLPGLARRGPAGQRALRNGALLRAVRHQRGCPEGAGAFGREGPWSSS